jgi:hypothetical protein
VSLYHSNLSAGINIMLASIAVKSNLHPPDQMLSWFAEALRLWPVGAMMLGFGVLAWLAIKYPWKAYQDQKLSTKKAEDEHELAMKRETAKLDADIEESRLKREKELETVRATTAAATRDGYMALQGIMQSAEQIRQGLQDMQQQALAFAERHGFQPNKDSR